MKGQLPHLFLHRIALCNVFGDDLNRRLPVVKNGGALYLDIDNAAIESKELLLARWVG